MKAVLIPFGENFNRLTVIEYAGKNKRGETLVKCKCSCGNEKVFRLYQVRNGQIKSCGCLAKELLVERNKTHRYTTHAHSRTRLYQIWSDMKQRCYNSQQKCFEYYGAKGIKVSDEWRNDFQTFYEWATSNGYSDSLTIDRIDVNGNYEPLNCRWITMKEQRRNTSRNIYVKIDGTIKVLRDWCEIYNIPYTTVQGRIKDGWDIIRAIQTPSRHIRRKII